MTGDGARLAKCTFANANSKKEEKGWIKSTGTPLNLPHLTM